MELLKLIKKYSNDMELGFHVRKLYPNNKAIKNIPNDMELGFVIRYLNKKTQYIN